MRTLILIALYTSALTASAAPNWLRATGRALISKPITLGAFELSMAIDWRTTVTCSNAQTCHEANPALIAVGAVPGTTLGTHRFTTVKLTEMAAGAALFLYANHKWPDSHKAFAIETWALTGSQAFIDYHNSTLAPKIH